jgi:hypothetical protein
MGMGGLGGWKVGMQGRAVCALLQGMPGTKQAGEVVVQGLVVASICASCVQSNPLEPFWSA